MDKILYTLVTEDGFVMIQIFGAYLYLDKAAPSILRAMGLVLIIAPFTYIAIDLLKAVDKIAATI